MTNSEKFFLRLCKLKTALLESRTEVDGLTTVWTEFWESECFGVIFDEVDEEGDANYISVETNWCERNYQFRKFKSISIFFLPEKFFISSEILRENALIITALYTIAQISPYADRNRSKAETNWKKFFEVILDGEGQGEDYKTSNIFEINHRERSWLFRKLEPTLV